MRDLFKEFGLDPEIALVDRQAVLHSAKAYSEEADRLAEQLGPPHKEIRRPTREAGQRLRQCLVIAATAFRRAGAHSILLEDWKAAPVHFASAGRAYEAAGLPYAALMNQLALVRERETSQFDHYTRARRLNEFEDSDVVLRTETWFKQQMVYPMLVDAAERVEFSDSRVFGLLRHELDQDRWKRTGVLGIPISIYLDLVSALSTGEPVHAATLFPLLEIYDNATRQAMSDRYHWRRFGTRYHPVEPDIFSIVLALRTYFRSQKQLLTAEIAEVRMHPFCREAILDVLRNYPEEPSGSASPSPSARA